MLPSEEQEELEGGDPSDEEPNEVDDNPYETEEEHTTTEAEAESEDGDDGSATKTQRYLPIS